MLSEAFVDNEWETVCLKNPTSAPINNQVTKVPFCVNQR